MNYKKLFGWFLLGLCVAAFMDFAWKFGVEVAAKVITTTILFAAGIILIKMEEINEFNPPA